MTDFESIYKQYFRDVYFFVLSLSRNSIVAEEITQETFFKALKSIHQFKGTCQLKVWLCQIAKNTYFSYADRQKRLEPDIQPPLPGQEDLESVLIGKESAFQIHQALHRLEEPYKEVFTLRIFGELSHVQIGQLFAKSESWSRVTFYRAKQKIQNMLKEEAYHD